MLLVQALQFVIFKTHTATLVQKALHKVFFKTTYCNACIESNAFCTSVAVLCVSMKKKIISGYQNATHIL